MIPTEAVHAWVKTGVRLRMAALQSCGQSCMHASTFRTQRFSHQLQLGT